MFESLQKLFLESKEGKIKLNQKASIFFFCLLLSSFFWFLSALSKDYTTELNFSTHYTGYSKDFILMEEPNEFIQGRVFGSGFELLGEQFALNRSPIPVDLKSARATNVPDQYFILTKNLRGEIREKLDQDLQLQDILPDTLYFKTQQRVHKEVPIKANLELNFSLGHHQRGEITLNPKMVSVSGPKGFMDTLQFLNTEQKRISDLADSTEVELKLVYPEGIKGVELGQEKLSIQIPVEKFTEKQLELMIEVNTRGKGYELKTFPNQISVRFLVPLSQYERLNAAQLTAYVEFDIEKDIQADKLQVQLSGIPAYAELIRIEPERVEFIVKK